MHGVYRDRAAWFVSENWTPRRTTPEAPRRSSPRGGYTTAYPCGRSQTGGDHDGALLVIDPTDRQYVALFTGRVLEARPAMTVAF